MGMRTGMRMGMRLGMMVRPGVKALLVVLVALSATALTGCGATDQGRNIEAIVSQQNGGEVEIVAKVTGVTLGRDSHLHVSVDDGPVVMVLTPPYDRYRFRNLSPGEHEIRVWVTDQQHRSLGMEDRVTVTVP